MNNLHVRHSAPRVLTLGSVRPVRGGFTVPSVIRHVLAAVTVVVKLTLECALLATSAIMELCAINSVH